MSDEKPETTPPRQGIFLPLPVIITILLALMTFAATYVFATKGELGEHRQMGDSRDAVLETRVDQHDQSIAELKTLIGVIDTNVRILMVRQGVQPVLTAEPSKKEKP